MSNRIALRCVTPEERVMVHGRFALYRQCFGLKVVQKKHEQDHTD